MPAILTVTMNPALDVGFDVERIVKESKLRGTNLLYQPGGGGINVARAATRLGADVECVWLGGGPTGEKLASLLERENIHHHQLRTAEDVRLSIHVEETSTTDMYRFVLPGPAISDAEIESVRATIATTNAPYIALSGSLPSAVPPDFYAQLAARAPASSRVILDTSGEPLGRGLAGRIYLAKPNVNELGRLLNRKLDSIDEIVRAARELIETKRVEVLAVSMAEKGLVLVTQDLVEHITAPHIEMVSAVGAGDSTVAGLVVGLSRGMSLPDAARLGVAGGTATCLMAGSELFRREDVERIYAQISK